MNHSCIVIDSHCYSIFPIPIRHGCIHQSCCIILQWIFASENILRRNRWQKVRFETLGIFFVMLVSPVNAHCVPTSGEKSILYNKNYLLVCQWKTLAKCTRAVQNFKFTHLFYRIETLSNSLCHSVNDRKKTATVEYTYRWEISVVVYALTW